MANKERAIERLMFKVLGFALITDSSYKHWIRFRDRRRKKRIATDEELALWVAASRNLLELMTGSGL